MAQDSQQNNNNSNNFSWPNRNEFNIKLIIDCENSQHDSLGITRVFDAFTHFRHKLYASRDASNGHLWRGILLNSTEFNRAIHDKKFGPQITTPLNATEYDSDTTHCSQLSAQNDTNDDRSVSPVKETQISQSIFTRRKR